ncbi:unnamed protein product [Rotaria socialis]|uniref:Uncharacterized protein n=1 Tax=Rotaria socialis TaxID=392032 RepID=A0A818RR26_9BILA|nr:unnamed protein product [Rotaria socialis]
MDSSNFVTDETSVVIVSLNISETNDTINHTLAKTFMKRPSNDSSINNIIFGIGLVVVILLLLVIVIKLIYKCYKMYHDDNGNENDDDDKEEVNKSPLLTSTAVRRDSSLRNPTAPAIRSSLNLETQMELRQKHLSKTFSDTPPTQKKL